MLVVPAETSWWRLGEGWSVAWVSLVDMAGSGKESVSSGRFPSGGEASRLCEGVGSDELAGVVLLERDWWLRRRPPGGGGRDVGFAELGSMAESREVEGVAKAK